jgi:hypothetical protein
MKHLSITGIKMVMTDKQEQTCIENIQGVLDRIYYLQITPESTSKAWGGPFKVCDLCEEFTCTNDPELVCTKCPLGPEEHGCGYEGDSKRKEANESYLTGYRSPDVNIKVLQRRLRYLLKAYKKAGLDIQIT